MIIELRGVEFINKGAELMLYAIIDKIRSAYPQAVFVMEKTGRTPIFKQRELGIQTKFKFARKGIDFTPIGRFIPRTIRKSLNLVLEREIDVILDGSGFAFGDKWGARKAGNRLANHIENWKKDGKVVILLPQAFGPFTGSEIRSAMIKIISNADRLFARDRMSLEYLNDLGFESGNIQLKPDFTNLIKGIVPDNFVKDRQVAIIPNFKMIENSAQSEDYKILLINTIKLVQDKGFVPFFLIHEGKMDSEIANEINTVLKNQIEILIEEHPLKVKGIIGNCKAIVTSRFHGLVSALSQGVPCLTTSWSHKYEMLLENYNYQEGLLEVGSSLHSISTKIDMILDGESNKAVSAKLISHSHIQKQETESMWQEVFKLLDQKSPAIK